MRPLTSRPNTATVATLEAAICFWRCRGGRRPSLSQRASCIFSEPLGGLGLGKFDGVHLQARGCLLCCGCHSASSTAIACSWISRVRFGNCITDVFENFKFMPGSRPDCLSFPSAEEQLSGLLDVLASRQHRRNTLEYRVLQSGWTFLAYYCRV